MNIIGIVVMVIAVFLTPLGLPGNWIMIGVLAIGSFYGTVGVGVLLAALALAFIGEGIEFLIVKRYNLRYGGSRRAFWGAIAGGMIGVVVGVPIPIIGSIIAAFVGTFIGAAVATLTEARTLGESARVGWGVLIGRAWSAAAKTAAGFVILVMGVAALWS